MVNEADLECHGFDAVGDAHRLSNDPTWLPAYLDRLERMVARPQPPQHLVLVSSATSGCGSNRLAMAERAQEMDGSRLVHYERCPEAEMADVYGSMYTHPDALAVLGAQSELGKRAVF